MCLLRLPLSLCDSVPVSCVSVRSSSLPRNLVLETLFPFASVLSFLARGSCSFCFCAAFAARGVTPQKRSKKNYVCGTNCRHVFLSFSFFLLTVFRTSCLAHALRSMLRAPPCTLHQKKRVFFRIGFDTCGRMACRCCQNGGYSYTNLKTPCNECEIRDGRCMQCVAVAERERARDCRERDRDDEDRRRSPPRKSRSALTLLLEQCSLLMVEQCSLSAVARDCTLERACAVAVYRSAHA